MIKFTVKQLFNYNVHLGYSANRWNPRCSVYIYGIRNGIHIINLENTFYMLNRALYFISDVIRRRGNLLMVNLKLGSYRYTGLRLNKFGQFSINNRYVGGLLTNFKNVKVKYKSLYDLYRLPSVIFVGNLNDCSSLVLESKRLGIPLVGISDSNVDPAYFTYPIPGNSESLVSNKFYYSLIFKAVYLGILNQRISYRNRKLKVVRNKFNKR